MKKVSVLFVVLAMTAIVGFACGGDAATPTSNPTATSLAPTATSPAVVEPTATAAASSDDHDDVALGQQLATAKACVACHSIDGSVLVGPSWKGLYGTTEDLEGGDTVTVDEAYLEESILDPTAKITKGFAPIMPPTPLTDDELHAIIAYIKSLE